MLLSKLIENILTWSYENFKVNRSCTCTDKRQKWQKRYNMSGHKCVWAQMCVGTFVLWAQSCVGTIVYGHNRVWAQSCLGTIVSGHNRVWAQTCVGTNVCGHNRVWAQSCQGTIVSGHNRVWAQSCLGTIVCGHNRVWAQSCVGAIVSGHKRVWAQSCVAQSCGLNRVGSIMYGPNRGGTVSRVISPIIFALNVIIHWIIWISIWNFRNTLIYALYTNHEVIVVENVFSFVSWGVSRVISPIIFALNVITHWIIRISLWNFRNTLIYALYTNHEVIVVENVHSFV